MRIQLLLILILVNLITYCCAQDLEENKPVEKSVYCEGGNCEVVIAISGLKIRDTMKLSGKVLGIVPFGEKVERVYPQTESGETIVDSITGTWLKIKYKEMVGYAFSGYLSYAINKMDQPFYLLIPNAGCGEYNYFSLKYNYYAFYKVNYIDAMEVRKVSPIFYVDWFTATVKADSSTQPEFFIASRDTMPTGNFNCSISSINLFSTREYNVTRGRKTIGLTNGEFYLDIDEFNSPDTIMKSLFLINQQTKERQLIAKSYFSFRLFWDGDLDLDGKTDFIIWKGIEDGGRYELYLSGKAKKGDFVKKVASFESGDCC